LPSAAPPQVPDVLIRHGLFAVEVRDGVTAQLIQRGLSVSAEGLGEPRLNASGRFIWTVEQPGPWPGPIRVTSRRLDLLSAWIPAPAVPADPALFVEAEHVARIDLRPTSAYPFDDDGITALRGRLFESSDPNVARVPVPLARVQLAYLHDGMQQGWRPAPPGPVPAQTSGPEVETDSLGEFAVCLRPADVQSPKLEAGQLRARVQVTREADGELETRWTPRTFEFQPGLANGLVPEARLLRRGVVLAWSDLVNSELEDFE
jgi:hypothetical protein